MTGATEWLHSRRKLTSSFITWNSTSSTDGVLCSLLRRPFTRRIQLSRASPARISAGSCSNLRRSNLKRAKERQSLLRSWFSSNVVQRWSSLPLNSHTLPTVMMLSRGSRGYLIKLVAICGGLLHQLFITGLWRFSFVLVVVSFVLARVLGSDLFAVTYSKLISS